MVKVKSTKRDGDFLSHRFEYQNVWRCIEALPM